MAYVDHWEMRTDQSWKFLEDFLSSLSKTTGCPFSQVHMDQLKWILYHKYHNDYVQFKQLYLEPTHKLFNILKQKGFHFFTKDFLILHFLPPAEHLYPGEMYFQAGLSSPGSLSLKFGKFGFHPEHGYSSPVTQSSSINAADFHRIWTEGFWEQLRQQASSGGELLFRMCLVTRAENNNLYRIQFKALLEMFQAIGKPSQAYPSIKSRTCLEQQLPQSKTPVESAFYPDKFFLGNPHQLHSKTSATEKQKSCSLDSGHESPDTNISQNISTQRNREPVEADETETLQQTTPPTPRKTIHTSFQNERLESLKSPMDHTSFGSHMQNFNTNNTKSISHSSHDYVNTRKPTMHLSTGIVGTIKNGPHVNQISEEAADQESGLNLTVHTYFGEESQLNIPVSIATTSENNPSSDCYGRLCLNPAFNSKPDTLSSDSLDDWKYH